MNAPVRDPTQQLADEYSATASDYASCWAPWLHGMSRPLTDQLPLKQARRVLDLGCGTGDLLRDLAAAAPGAAVIGVDRSAGMLKTARARGPFPAAVMDARRLALGTGTFDVVVMAFMLFHVTEPVLALTETLRVLRPGGSAGVVVWGATAELPGLEIWSSELDAAGALPETRPPEVLRHQLMDTRAKLAALLAAAGFEPLRTWGERPGSRWQISELLQIHTRCGIAGRRLRTVTEPARAACLDRVRRRFERLAPDDLRDRSEALFAVARRP